jgi:hypothetical protein
MMNLGALAVRKDQIAVEIKKAPILKGTGAVVSVVPPFLGGAPAPKKKNPP